MNPRAYTLAGTACNALAFIGIAVLLISASEARPKPSDQSGNRCVASVISGVEVVNGALYPTKLFLPCQNTLLVDAWREV